jgi:tagatose-6-phosphate ketose/aldose isomerase
VEAARVVAASFPDVAHVAVTCNAEGKLAKLVSAHPRGLCLALHERAYDKGLGTTSSMTGTVVAGQLLVDPSRRPRVEALAAAAEKVLAGAEGPQQEAAKNPDRVVVLGTGPLEYAAQEVAHKVMELTDGQVSTMARSYLEFRHGPIAFVNPRTLVLCLRSPDATVARYERDFMAQASQMRALSVVEPETGGSDPGESAVLSIVYGQMLALFASIHRGLRPDRPGDRGLVNPVVQGVTIYPRTS